MDTLEAIKVAFKTFEQPAEQLLAGKKNDFDLGPAFCNMVRLLAESCDTNDQIMDELKTMAIKGQLT
jgi:hypothetical protein